MADDFADGLDGALERAGDGLASLADGPAARAAASIETAFERAGRSIEIALTRAARTGEFSFKALAESVASSLASLAIDRVFDRVASSSALSSLPFFGGRADGGVVVPGGAYLVGERGPEVFTPSAAGTVGAPGAGVTVNIHVAAGGDIDAVRRSQGQISTMVARAVARGRKNL